MINISVTVRPSASCIRNTTVTALFVSRATGDSPPLAAQMKMRIKNGEARGMISRV
jgi:hypothetical protein